MLDAPGSSWLQRTPPRAQLSPSAMLVVPPEKVFRKGQNGACAVRTERKKCDNNPVNTKVREDGGEEAPQQRFP